MIVYEVNFGTETTGDALNCFSLTERNYCCRQENSVLINCNVIVNCRSIAFSPGGIIKEYSHCLLLLIDFLLLQN